MIEGCFCVWEPGREEASNVQWHLMNGSGVCIGKYIYLSMWTEVGELGAVVLVAFDMIWFDFDREGGDKTLNSLDDVIVGL
jgi:hypothetical protein